MPLSNAENETSRDSGEGTACILSHQDQVLVTEQKAPSSGRVNKNEFVGNEQFSSIRYSKSFSQYWWREESGMQLNLKFEMLPPWRLCRRLGAFVDIERRSLVQTLRHITGFWVIFGPLQMPNENPAKTAKVISPAVQFVT
jgi:hypothetical protein